MHGYPNLLTTAVPLAPSAALCNMTTCLQQQTEWISDAIAHVREQGKSMIEPTKEGEDAWVAHHEEIASATVVIANTTPGTWARTCPASPAACCPTSAAWAPTGRSATRWRAPATPASSSSDRDRSSAMGTRIDGSAIDKVLQEAVDAGAVPHVAAIAADRDG